MFVVGALPPRPSAGLPTSKPEFSTGSLMDIVQQRGHLRVGMTWGLPGFGFYDEENGTLAGFEADVARILAHGIFGGYPEDAARRVELVATDFDQRANYLNEHHVDMMLGTYADTLARRSTVDFAGHYMTSKHAPLLGDRSPVLDNVDDLNGLRVAVVSGTTDLEILSRIAPDAEIDEHRGPAECLNALHAGTVQAFWSTTAANRSYIKYLAGGLHQAHFEVGGETWAIGLRKGDPTLRRFIDHQVAAALQSGRFNGAFRKWLD